MEDKSTNTVNNENTKVKTVTKVKDPKKKFSYRFKKWFFGIGKEFGRITWPNKSRIIKDFFTVIILVAIIALIFLGFDQISGLIK